MTKLIKKQPDYYKTIPKELWLEADNLVKYVTTFPYKVPTECPYCGSHELFNRGPCLKKLSIDQFRCLTCQRLFNQLTLTHFHKTLYVELWPDFIRYRLSGLSLKKIKNLLSLSTHAIHDRNKILTKLLKDNYPKLYRWWYPHQSYQDNRITKEVKKELSFFLQWLTERIEAKEVRCIRCEIGIARRLKNTSFMMHCTRKRCLASFSIFTQTPLLRMKRPQIWGEYIKALVLGKTNDEIAQQIDLSANTISPWRSKFITQMQQLGLNELVYWIKWQHKCNTVATLSNIRPTWSTRPLRKQP